MCFAGLPSIADCLQLCQFGRNGNIVFFVDSEFLASWRINSKVTCYQNSTARCIQQVERLKEFLSDLITNCANWTATSASELQPREFR